MALISSSNDFLTKLSNMTGEGKTPALDKRLDGHGPASLTPAHIDDSVCPGPQDLVSMHLVLPHPLHNYVLVSRKEVPERLLPVCPNGRPG
jgi:hypothetical protein